MFRVISMVNKGRLEEWKGKALKEILAKFEGKAIIITVQEFYKPITNKQLRFVNGVFLPALHQLYLQYGLVVTFESLRESFKEMFAPRETIYHPDGSVTSQPKSMKDWSRQEASIAAEQARAHYASYGELPFPTSEEKGE